jgi:hypothetical protein
VSARIRSQIAPGWLFSVAAVLGLSAIALAAAATGVLLGTLRRRWRPAAVPPGQRQPVTCGASAQPVSTSRVTNE